MQTTTTTTPTTRTLPQWFTLSVPLSSFEVEVIRSALEHYSNVVGPKLATEARTIEKLINTEYQSALARRVNFEQ